MHPTPDRLILRQFGLVDYALSCRRRFALFIAAVRLAARRRAAVRSRDFRRRCARHRLVRRFPRPDRRREEISDAVVRHHPRDPLLGQSRPRRAQRGGRKNFALDRRGPRTRHRLRRRQPDHRRHAVLRCARGGTGRWSSSASRPSCTRPPRQRLPRWIWVHHAPPANSPTSWGGKRYLRRRRTGAVDRALPALDGDLGPRAPVALHSRRLVVRPARRHLGVQHRPAARPPAGLHRARYRRRDGVLAFGRRGAIDRPQGAAAAAGRADRDPPPWLTSLDRIADPSLARPLSAAG